MPLSEHSKKIVALVAELLESTQAVVIMESFPIKDVLSLELLKSDSDPKLIWVDRQRTIHSHRDLFDAIEVALRIYWDMNYNWNCLNDFLRNGWCYPQEGCLLYFHDLSKLKKNDPESYRILCELLTVASNNWDTKGRLIKSLIVLRKQDNQ